jgi:IclR family acetate operon transcriptional repressor
MNEPRPPKGAQAALRAVRLLKLFTIERPEMSLAELRQRSGIERNTVTAAYSLGAGLMALGVQALASSDLRRRVRPLLRALANDTGETATLEVPIGDSMLILDEVTGRHVIGAAGNVGTRWPLHATSTGKAVLAFDDHGLDRLPETLEAITSKTLVSRESFHPEFVDIRRRGYAVTVDELEDGFTAVATVIRTPLGDVQGALSLSGPTQRLTSTRRAELGASLCKAASRLSPGL